MAYYFQPIDKEFDELARQLYALDYHNQREKTDANLLNRLDSIAKKRGNKQLKARALYWRVRMGQMSAQPRKCIAILNQALKLSSPSYRYDNACINYQLAGNYDRIGDYLKCYNLGRSAEEVFKEVGDNYYQGNAALLLAQLYIDIDMAEQAREALDVAEQCYSMAKRPLNRIYFFRAQLSEGKNSLSLYYKSVSTGGNDWAMTIQALSCISSAYITTGHLDSAMVYVDKALAVVKNQGAGNPIFTSLMNIQKGLVLYEQHHYDEAISLLSEVSRQKGLDDEKFMAELYKYLWLSWEAKGNYNEAYSNLKLYQKYYERNEESLKKREVPKALAREMIARQNDQMKILEKNAQLSRYYMYLALLLVIVVALIVAVVAIWFRQRYRLRKIENRELRNSLQQETLIYNMNLKNFENDIKHKDCEISSSTLLLANKNEVLQQISDITKRYYDNGKIPLEYVNQINSTIKNSLQTDDEWSRFKFHFDSVHPNFFVKLKEKCSDLTENDLRLCAYISIGLRAKEIAEMLNVTPDSVNTNRYRLRKKLGLRRGESLDEFIRKLGEN
ncbi:MAG: tetratricopeptide repeat protein [Prevotella sp.]